AWRQAGGRLAIRFPLPAPEVWQHGSISRLCLRSARSGCQSTLARLCAEYRAAGARTARTTDLPVGAAHGTGISLWIGCEYPVDSVVLSGVPGIVLSGVKLSCYQAYKTSAKPRHYWLCASLNLTNLNTLTND